MTHSGSGWRGTMRRSPRIAGPLTLSCCFEGGCCVRSEPNSVNPESVSLPPPRPLHNYILPMMLTRNSHRFRCKYTVQSIRVYDPCRISVTIDTVYHRGTIVERETAVSRYASKHEIRFALDSLEVNKILRWNFYRWIINIIVSRLIYKGGGCRC